MSEERRFYFHEHGRDAQLGDELVVCPDCAFEFHAQHEEEDGHGYSCPVCAEQRLRTLARELYGALDRLRKAAWSTMPDDVAFFDADAALHRAREAGIGGEDG